MQSKSNTAATVLSLFLLVAVFSLLLPAQEPAPTQEQAQEQESVPAQAQEPAPAQEQAEQQEPAPVQEQAREQEPAPAEEQVRGQAQATYQGELWSVDTMAKTLVVRQSAGTVTEMKFFYNEMTEIVGSAEAKGVEGLATMKGTQVKVHYKSEADQHTAVRIEILPSKQAMQ